MVLASPAFVAGTHFFLFAVVITFIGTVLWSVAYFLGIKDVLNLPINWALSVSVLPLHLTNHNSSLNLLFLGVRKLLHSCRFAVPSIDLAARHMVRSRRTSSCEKYRGRFHWLFRHGCICICGILPLPSIQILEEHMSARDLRVSVSSKVA